MSKYRLTHADLVARLREQVQFLKASAASYDGGYEAEARRLAGTIRTLVYDEGRGSSVLEQLGVKEAMRFIDTRVRPPGVPGAIVLHSGLAIMRATLGETSAQGRYVPPLDNLSPDRMGPPVPFRDWWELAVMHDKSGGNFSRSELILTTANKTGAAHVDPELDQAWVELTKGTSLPIVFATGEGPGDPAHGDPTLASVRQIAWELERTLHNEVPHLLDDDALGPDKPLPRMLTVDIGRNDPCPCGSGQKYKRCHGKPQ
jgi:hypothetical protein